MTVATICTRLPETTSADVTVLAAARQMLDQEVGTLVVTDGDGRPEGIVSLDDFLEGLAATSEDIGRLLRRQVHV